MAEPQRKGIILAGGSGTRLYPLTHAVSKQLLPVYDKPMIYYPLSCLMLAGIRDVLVISTPTDLPQFQRLLRDGGQWGMQFHYAAQARPNGLAEALIIGADFVGHGDVALVLGDNVFYGQGFAKILRTAAARTHGATIFGHRVLNPQRYGVVELDPQGQVLSIEEKPRRPKSHFAIPGLYFFDHQAVEMARSIKPSSRGELEITEINQRYLQQGELNVEVFSRGFTWLDAGTHESLAEATNLVMAIEKRQGVKIGCPEEIAHAAGWINDDQLAGLARSLPHDYGDYLRSLL
ncbi:MAG: glucose-1-phosphate thymidylyltransferase RfbA [Planctomycetota bacterium]